MSRFSCIFPTLTDGYVPNPDNTRAAGQRTYAIDLSRRNAPSSETESHILAAWGLVLYSYVGTDEVAFYVVPKSGPDTTALAELKVEGDMSRQALTHAAEQLFPTGSVGAGQVSGDTANTIIDFANDIESLFVTQTEESFLSLHVHGDEQGHVSLSLTYHLSLLTDLQAANVGTAMAQALAEVGKDDCDRLIKDLNLMSPTHLEHIWKFNANVPGTWEECFHDVIERHAANRPHSLAVDAWDTKLTYADLVREASLLAAYLQQRGVRPGSVVPISFERSGAALVAMLAVSKAGGAFVSVPPNLPAGRLDAILEVIEAPFVVTWSKYESFWAERLPTLPIDNYPKPSADAAVEALGKPEDLFYVIFTSGSTGRPKGCMLSHSNWLNGALRNAPSWKYGPESRVLQMLSHTFDMSLLEICTSLGSGACVCVPRTEEIETSVSDAINRWQVNHVIMTPSLARALRPDDVPGLKTMCLGGEAFPKEIVTMWSERINLWQFYGPSECSINSSSRAITRPDADPLNIGPPNSAACWVVDTQDYNKLVPVGAIGELLVSGPIVGMGYLKNPVKTAEAFLDQVGFVAKDDPQFGGFRFYRTGDLVRWNSDGTITFCGRADTQVKLNGQRLELAEVEYQLGLEAGVQYAIAMAPQTGRCKNNLIAILTVKGTSTSNQGNAAEISLLDRRDPIVQQTVKKLRSQLQHALPRYMVPTIWAFVGRMPMSPSGKIDRVQLRNWVQDMSQEAFDAITGRSFEAEDHVLGLSRLEQEIQLAWAEALGLSAAEVGVQQPFVALGGDSIKALDAVARCRARQIKISMVHILSCEGVREAASLAKVQETPAQQVAEMAVDYSDLWTRLSTDYELGKLGISQLEEVEDVFPCTTMQEGMFLGQIRRPGAYHMRFFHRVQLKGGCLPPVERIQQAWAALVERHPSLRTVFVDDLSPEAIYHSVVLRSVPMELTMREVPRDLNPEAALAMFTEELVPFRPNAPLHRMLLLTCRGRVPYFMLEISHVIMDGYALSVFRREFIQACSSTAPLPRGPDYRMFANYHRTRQTDESAKYWTDYLADCTGCHIPTHAEAAPTDVPPKWPRTLQRRDFGFDNSAAFLQRCKERQVTLACAIRAAWALVLRAYTQSQDVCFGYVSSGRNVPVPEVETIFGLCLSMQVCRAKLSEASTMARLARKIQEDYVASLPFQHYPLAEAQRGLKQTRGQGLFNTAISMEWVPPTAEDENALLDLEEIREQDDPTEYDIAISVDVHEGHIKLGFLYWPNLTDFEIAHLAEALQGALNCFAFQPDEALDSLTLLQASDFCSTLGDRSTMLPLEAVRGNVMSMIDGWVTRQPESAAIDGWDGSLSYKKLHEQSSWVAHNLLHQGVQPGDRVLVCADRSSRTVATILGLVRAGCVLVLSTPTDPEKRLQWLAQKCNAALVVADPAYEKRFATAGPRVLSTTSVCVPAAWDYEFPALDEQDLVSILFTSGSTGTPKGTLMDHGALATSVLLGHGRTLRFSRHTRMLHFASLTFDAALAEIFTTLAHGGCICVPCEEDRLSDVPGCISRFAVNTAMLTPSVGRLLDPGALPTLKALVMIGEPMSRLDVERFAPVLDLYNGAGPTETSIMVTIAGPMKPTDDPVNLGYPVTGVRLWVTEAENPNRLAPLGAVGELIVEGRLVTRGYLDDPSRTQEAFLTSLPWLPSQHALYRTGDLVRYADDGSLRYMGRKDTQVKLRGQRIELQEVEYHLRKILPQAQVVVEMVVPEGKMRAQASLVAFVSGLTAADVESSSACNFEESMPMSQIVFPRSALQTLEEALPRHMIPSVYYALDTIPLSINGKVDRRRLREMGAALLASSAAHKGAVDEMSEPVKWTAASELERTLSELWAATLELEAEAIHCDDSFFELGGDSVSAMKLVAMARDQFKLSLSVPQMFRYPTIRQLAAEFGEPAGQSASSASSTTEEGFTFSTPDDSSTNDGVDDDFLQLATAQLAQLAREKGKKVDIASLLKQLQGSSSSSKTPSGSSSSSSSSSRKKKSARVVSPVKVPAPVPVPFSLLDGGADVVEKVCVYAVDQCKIPHEDIEDIYPATALQEGMMALMARTPGVYTTTLTCELPEQVDFARLHAAWDKTAEAHPILRTRIILTDNNTAMQVVQRAKELPWDTYYLQDGDILPDLTSNMTLGSPLLRLAEIHRQDQPRMLMVAIHHALYDGWSMPLLKQAVEDVYHGRPLQSQPFTPFINYLNAGKPAAQAFWTAHLDSFAGGVFPTLPSIDHHVQLTERRTRSLTVPAALPGSQYTLATKIQTAWAVTVSRYAEAEDIVFGTVSTGRSAPVPAIDRMVGPTITTVPVRISLSDQAERVISLLQRVQEDGWNRMDHEHLGLQHIRRLGESCAATCSLQTLLVIQPREQPRAKSGSTLLAGLQDVAELEGVDTYPLMLVCEPDGASLHLTAMFDPAVLDEVMLGRMLAHWELILTQLWSEPDMAVMELDALSHSDRQTLVRWNAGERVADGCAHDAVHEWSVRTPHAPAVCAWDGEWTYEELEKCSSLIVRQILAHGVSSGDFVALYHEKSRWAAAGILAVFKAGGILVTLDPAHPKDRIKDIVYQARPRLILTSQSLLGEARELEVPVLSVSFAASQQTPEECSPLPIVSSTQAAYAPFTSGSTGRPKGIVLDHRGLAASTASVAHACLLRPASRVLHFASFAFDASMMEHLIAWHAGGCLCIPDETARQTDLASCIRDFEITWAFLTPSCLRLITPDDVQSLEALGLGGESMTSEDISIWGPRLRQIVQLYGPAECCIVAALTEVTKPSENRLIGRPNACRCWVVDPQNPDRLAPLGAVGELVIEGITVGWGYIDDPERTTQAFIRPPTWLQTLYPNSQQPGRLYRTGDLVRYAGADGKLTFIGRRDGQLKLHGQRIELADVEAHLRPLMPGTQKIVVEMVHSADNQHPLLAAFVEEPLASQNPSEQEVGLLHPSQTQCALDVKAIDSVLSRMVPQYMIPSMYLHISRLPLSASGKLNRRHLREIVAEFPRQRLNEYAAGSGLTVPDRPVTAQEREMQAIWARVLSLDPDTIGINEDFFRIGGDSISGMQVATKCNAAGMHITGADLFRHRTIEQLMRHLSATRKSGCASISLPAEPVGEWVALAPIQQLFFEIAPQGPNHFNQSLLLRTGRRVSVEELAGGLDILVERHSMLRARFCRDDSGQWSQQVRSLGSYPASAFYRLATHNQVAPQSLPTLLTASQLALSIQEGPLLAVDLVDLADGAQLVYLVAHHLIIDLVSWRILHGELEEYLQTGSLASATGSVSFLTWSRAQAEYSANHLTPTRALPDFQEANDGFDAPKYWGISSESNTFGQTSSSRFTLDRTVTDQLFGSANNVLDTRPVEILQAALWYSFTRSLTDRPGPSIYVEGHGREPWTESIDLSRTVGWFTTMSPLVSAPWDSLSRTRMRDFLDALSYIKDQRRRIPANGWAYFTSRYLNDEGKVAYGRMKSVVEIMFNYMGQYQEMNREDAILQLAGDDIQSGTGAADIAGNVPRFSLIDVSAFTANGCLTFEFIFPESMQQDARLKQWFKECERTLIVAASTLSTESPRKTLTDFPLMPALTYDQLNQCLDQTLPSMGLCARDVVNIYPCSSVQQGMLLAQLRDQQAYQQRLRFQVNSRGPTDRLTLERVKDAWTEVINRHDILRTLLLPVSDYNHLDQVVMAPGSLQHLVRMNAMDANPTQGLPHSINITSDSTGTVICEWNVSHALVDAMSIAVIQREVNQALQGSLGQHQNLPRYADYVQWLSLQDNTETQAYWQNYLEGVEPCLFPKLTSLPDKVNPEGTISAIRATWTRDARMHDLCQKHGITLTNLFHMIWALVLGAYVGTDEVCFGYTTLGRDVPVDGVEKMVGPLVNVVATIVQLQEDDSILNALLTHQTHLTNSLQHQHYALADLYASSGLVGSRLFNTIVSLQDMSHFDAPDEQPTWLEMLPANDVSEYDVALNIGVDQSSIQLVCSYRTLSLSAVQADALLRTASHVLSEMLRDPTQRFSELEVISPECKEQLMKWNAAMPAPTEEYIHEKIQGQCRLHASREAVCAWDGIFTYAEVDDLSSRLAARLIRMGVTSEHIIPIYAPKSRWTVIAILGVLKSGAAFTLLETSHPMARLQVICHEIKADMIIAPASHAGPAANLAPIIVGLDRITSMSPQTSDLLPTVGMPPAAEALAYLIFTSGSTGNPKGVMVTHQNLCSNASIMTTSVNMMSDSRVLQFASHAFDGCLWEILGPLFAGACLIIPSESESQEDLAGCIERMVVTWAFLTPSVARILKPETLPSLRVLTLGGEPIAASDLDMWRGHVQVVCAYGPTETTILASTTSPSTFPTDGRDIGVPTGSSLWIVDKRNYLKLAPLGATGELLIEGPNVSQGYLGDPEKTNEAFPVAPRWLSQLRQSPTRIYRTGDLVRFDTSTGTIRFVGRKDNQIKFHGQRIELGEIEHHAQQAFSNSSTVIVDLITPAQPQRPYIVAFVHQPDTKTATADPIDAILLPPSESFRAEALGAQNHMHKRLPHYMVPTVFLPLQWLPLSGTGKADRKRLRQCALALPSPDLDAYRATALMKRMPSTAAERKMQELVATVLGRGVSEIGMDDSFFYLGGDSVQAMRLVAEGRHQGLALSLRAIFDAPRLGDLAYRTTNLVKVNQPIQATSPVTLRDECNHIETIVATHPIKKTDVVDVLPTTSFQRHWLDIQLMSYIVVDIPGPIDPERLLTAMQRVVEAHPILRASFVPYEDTTMQVILRTRVAMTAADLSTTTVEDICRQDEDAPMILGTPYMRVILASQGDVGHKLIMRLSHAQYDAVSLSLLMNDLRHAYANETRPFPSSHSPPFTDYITYQQTLRADPTATTFWHSLLQDVPITCLNLQPAETSTSNGTPITRTRDINISPFPSLPNGITIATAVKAAWSLVLAQKTDSLAVIFGQVVHGRGIALPGVEGIVGPCANITPVVARLGRQTAGLELMQTLQDQHRSAMPYETVDLDDALAYSKDSQARRKGLQTIVQHQNNVVVDDMELSLGEVKCGVDVRAVDHVPREVWIYSSVDEKRPRILEVKIMSSTLVLNEEVAEELMDLLIEKIVGLFRDPEGVCV
ncbi:acetyl-CoA synthetase-like protein [Aspergillus homomorphus CBS 101889]|uniref:Malformin synthetase mlfA n=1 Tax=Aspergillus homomorphus (strain CBS 101889) TaxID=1450537 RepID=MLFA_ASPHC|nr:acetyl-CoA synthetase-like protein [Aspergillus homomorphus CBS 101889]A0A395I3F8.1 RecName: Full=Malformin synthetase mlfA; AltName: Full=Malformin biosynthesis cluster protein A; AltName: Full=Nonribosomal peptide synthetase mlfA [Aspergillus homomorphus CBS 101889]RAL14731.1 acetyl-CoA synthetase-like protein [Aspergillus homomorphus CBS 101889]